MRMVSKKMLRIMTLSITALTALSITTLTMTALRIMTPSIMPLNSKTLGITHNSITMQNKYHQHY